jgi:ATP-dependent helicase/nuclease subunit A
LNVPALTAQQQEAVAARGNVLVVAGAGAGKTRTLVERCLAWLLDEQNHGSVDEILMVTFTQAAAAEMRKRLREGLERAQTSSPRLAEQLALLETAHICTLHSFCFELVSQHFYELGLDPQLTVMSNEESHALARRTLDAVLETVYNSDQPSDLAIQRLIQATGGDWDQPVRDLMTRLHKYSQTLRDPAAWFAAQEAGFQSEEPAQWRAWLMAELNHWRATWLPLLQRQPPENKNAACCAAALEPLGGNASRADFAAALALIEESDQSWPKPKSR